jgi:hypothetical protein
MATDWDEATMFAEILLKPVRSVFLYLITEYD